MEKDLMHEIMKMGQVFAQIEQLKKEIYAVDPNYLKGEDFLSVLQAASEVMEDMFFKKHISYEMYARDRSLPIEEWKRLFQEEVESRWEGKLKREKEEK